MKKQVIIDAMFNYERIALLEDGVLKEILFEEKVKFNVGDIIIAKVLKILKNKFIFLNIGDKKSAFLDITDRKQKNIANLNIKTGDEILVQIEKESTSLKGFSVTSKLSLEGKYCIIILDESYIKFSKRIENDTNNLGELEKMVADVLPPDYGIVLRTNSKNAPKDAIIKEILYLVKKAEYIKNFKAKNAPQTIFFAKNKAEIMIQNFLDKQDEVIVNNENYYKNLKQKNIFSNIKLYNQNTPIFEIYDIESQLDKIFNKKVWLKCGGFLIIESFEAMHVIDINTGKNIKKDYEKMILKTNLEAAYEISKQIRLRNLSGLILIDFIDMQNKEYKDTIFKEMQKFISEDKKPVFLNPIDKYWIMTITRKKTTKSNDDMLTKPCICCDGQGRIKNEKYLLNKIANNLLSIASSANYKYIEICANKEIINSLKKDTYIKNIKDKCNISINFEILNNCKYDYFEIKKYIKKEK